MTDTFDLHFFGPSDSRAAMFVSLARGLRASVQYRLVLQAIDSAFVDGFGLFGFEFGDGSAVEWPLDDDWRPLLRQLVCRCFGDGRMDIRPCRLEGIHSDLASGQVRWLES